jgi:hypothetical protein
VNAYRFTAACTPRALDNALCHVSYAECQLALPCATARLLMYIHSDFLSSGIGGAGVFGTGVPTGSFTVVSVAAGYLVCVLFPVGGLISLICARSSAAVIGSFRMGVFTRLLVFYFAASRATYRSRIDSSLSTDSEVEIISMYAIGTAFSLPLYEAGCGYFGVGSSSLLVVGFFTSFSVCSTKLMMFGDKIVGTGAAWTMLLVYIGVWAGGFGLFCLVWPDAIIPSNLRRAS